MKKSILLIVLMIITSFLLCSCFLFGGQNETETTEGTTAEDVELDQIISAVNGNTDLDALSLDELLELYDKFLKDGRDALNDGAEYDLLYKDVEIGSGDASSEIGFDYYKGAQIATYSDDKWEEKKTFEALDPTANMSAEDKANYEQALQELEEFDVKEFQRGIDEMLKSMEGFEEYEPVEIGTDIPSISNEWPDNEITRQVPKPPFKDPMIVTDEESITIMQMNSKLEDAKSYAKQLKDAGFTIDVNENSNEVVGFSIYTFSAQNKNGLFVSLNFASGTTSVTITKN